MNLFYKIHLQVFNVISIVLYHSSPTFGKVLYSRLDAFVVDASDYSVHLIRHLLNANEAFPTEWFLQFWEQVKVWWAQLAGMRWNRISTLFPLASSDRTSMMYTCCCMYSPRLLMTDGKTVRNM
jgi:hypothetical protein